MSLDGGMLPLLNKNPLMDDTVPGVNDDISDGGGMEGVRGDGRGAEKVIVSCTYLTDDNEESSEVPSFPISWEILPNL